MLSISLMTDKTWWDPFINLWLERTGKDSEGRPRASAATPQPTAKVQQVGFCYRCEKQTKGFSNTSEQTHEGNNKICQDGCMAAWTRAPYPMPSGLFCKGVPQERVIADQLR